jgi:hypothetical protein
VRQGAFVGRRVRAGLQRLRGKARGTDCWIPSHWLHASNLGVSRVRCLFSLYHHGPTAAFLHIPAISCHFCNAGATQRGLSPHFFWIAGIVSTLGSTQRGLSPHFFWVAGIISTLGSPQRGLSPHSFGVAGIISTLAQLSGCRDE